MVTKKSAIIVVAMLMFMNIAFSAEVQNNPADEALSYSNQAARNFQRRDIQGAIDCLNQAISISPNNPQLYLNRGFVKHFLRDYDGAIQDYNSAIRINPQFAFGYNNRGVLKVATGDIDGAFADYDTALSINPRYSDVYYNRGNLRYMLDDNEGALSDYDKAIELNPKDSEAYNNRGVVKKRMDYNVGALSDYSQAIALNPNDSIAYANRGRLKKLYFDNEGAAIDLNQAVALAENQTFIKNVKPLLSAQRYVAAIPTAKSFELPAQSVVKQSAPKQDNPDLVAMSKPVSNVKNVSNNTKPIPTPTPVPANNAKSYSKSDTPMLSAGVGKVALPEVPDIRTNQVTEKATTNVKLAESYYIRGLQKCILHDLNGAVSDLDKAIANNSKYADAYYYRAAIKKELGDSEGFKKDYSTAIQIKPSLQGYNDNDVLSLING